MSREKRDQLELLLRHVKAGRREVLRRMLIGGGAVALMPASTLFAQEGPGSGKGKGKGEFPGDREFPGEGPRGGEYSGKGKGKGKGKGSGKGKGKGSGGDA